MTELRRAACRLVDRDKPIFPCRPNGKEPLTSNGFKDASVDRAIVLHWWGRWPDANIAMPTGHASGFLVLDLDGPEGMDTFARIDAHGPGLNTLEVATGTGVHLYFRMPDPDIGTSNAAIKARFGPSVDVRGNGGYVIVPPSRHPNGTRYQWGAGQVLPTPDWLVEILTAPAPTPTVGAYRPASVVPISGDRLLARFNAHLERVANEPEGSRNRNKLLHWAACRLRELQEEGAPEGWTELLVQAGVAAGLEEASVRRSVQSGLRGAAS